MNNQLPIDELRELAEVMRDYAEESRSVGSERLESYYVGKAVAFEEVISMIESSLVPTIGCSECEYKGYFEYETGVVDEGTQIKEIAKEPCDCVIDRVPTIKPGDKGYKCSACRESSTSAEWNMETGAYLGIAMHFINLYGKDSDTFVCPKCGGRAAKAYGGGSGMSRELQKDKLDNLIKRCETSKSYGDTICIDPDVVISLIQQYAAEKERADKAEQEVCLLEKKIKDLKNEVNELNEVVNASIESTRLVRESLEKLMDYPKEETK